MPGSGIASLKFAKPGRERQDSVHSGFQVSEMVPYISQMQSAACLELSSKCEMKSSLFTERSRRHRLNGWSRARCMSSRECLLLCLSMSSSECVSA